ncbi:MAG: hypothetical protein VKO21_00535 [Candidatus Sericytochromatia bacterium]|nr:hypothetical protein [Candidatus Sericytochromatia bacterium]
MTSIFGPRLTGASPQVPVNPASAASTVSHAAEGENLPLPATDVNGTRDLPGRSSGLQLPEEAREVPGVDLETLAEGALRSTTDLGAFLNAALDAGLEGVTRDVDGLSAQGPALELLGTWTGTPADDRSLASLGIVGIRLSA